MIKKFLLLILIFAAVGTGLSYENHPVSEVIERIKSREVSYPFRFAFIGDSRKSFRPGDPDADSIFRLHLRVLEGLNPAFVIHGGDFCLRGYRSEYEHFVSMIDSFDVNLLPVAGNHELYAPEGPYMFRKIFQSKICPPGGFWNHLKAFFLNPFNVSEGLRRFSDPCDYYFDYAGYRFIFLVDNHQSPKKSPKGGYYVNYYLSEKQIKWLEKRLKEADSLGLFKVVVAHVPPYIPDHNTKHCLGAPYYYPKPNYEKSHTKEFTDLLAKYHVSLGLFSHQHLYDRYVYDGVTYIVSGGAGAPLKRPLQEAPYGGSFYHIVLFEADSTGFIKGHIYRLGETEPDTTFDFVVPPPVGAE